MPYRRLPNTDVARIKALKIAYLRGKEIPPFKLAFTQSTLQKVQSFLPSFEKSILEYKQSFQIQISRNADYQREIKRARMYLSHFVQVLNMAIIRGDMPASIRTYYGLRENQKSLPPLNTEADLIKWGERVIQGEQLRTMKGQTAITNPTIAVVKVRYENFLEAYRFQKTLQKNVQRTLDKLSSMRNEADEIITFIWNEVEEYYKCNSDDEKRGLCENYGVVYVFRKNELKEVRMER